MSRRRSQLEHYVLNPMGLAAANRDGTIDLYHSNRPSEHAAEARNTDEKVTAYISSPTGQNFVDYVHSHGREFMKFKVGAADLGSGTIAALVHNTLEGILVSNYEGETFEQHLADFAQQYGLDQEAAFEYVINHEMTHAAHCYGEAETETFLKNYFTFRASQTEGEEKEKYQQLAKVAESRAEEAQQAEQQQYEQRKAA